MFVVEEMKKGCSRFACSHSDIQFQALEGKSQGHLIHDSASVRKEEVGWYKMKALPRI